MRHRVVATTRDGGRLELRILPDDRIEIVRADPEIHIAEELLAHTRARNCRPEISLGDGIFSVRASNGSVSYGLAEYDLQRNWWRAVKSA